MDNRSVVTAMEADMEADEEFCHNPDNFLHKDKSQNSELDKKANLAEKFGYTAQQFGLIKALADMQFQEDIDFDEGGITVEWEEDGMDVHCPWMDCTARFELTDVGAINLYGEAFLREWCRKANEALKDEGLMKQLKDWSERTSYVEKFPYRNPIERFGLVW